MFNPFEICVVEKYTGRTYRKNDIDDLSNYSNTIVLLELKERVNNNKFKLGDIYFDEDKRDYYIFTLIKAKNDLDSKSVNGYGFFVFNENINLPGECKLYHGIKFIKEKRLDYLCNIFRDKENAVQMINCHYMKEYYNYLSDLNRIEFYFQFDDGKIIHNTLVPANQSSKIFTNEIMQDEFSFNVIYNQKLLLDSMSHRTVICNGALIQMRDEVKQFFLDRKALTAEILMNNNIVDADVIPEKILENSSIFFNKFFIFLEDGSVKLTSLNKALNYDEVDYTQYIKITGNKFVLIQNESSVKEALLEFVSN